MSDDTVTLRAGGSVYAGWLSVDITRSMETVSGGFGLGVTEQWPGHQDRYQLAPGMRCHVAIGGETVIAGWIDDVEPSYTSTDHAISVQGRDATGDLADASALHGTGHWASASLYQIATDLCAPFGVKVITTVPDVHKVIPEHHIQMGETVLECLRRLCAAYGVLPMSDGQGGLLLTRAGDGGAAASLRLGNNVLAGRGTASDRERYGRYIILGQIAGGAYLDPATFTAQHAEAVDPGIDRYRPLIVMAEDSIDPTYYQRRATWEAATRAGKSRRATITVQGWRDAAGALYRPNTIVTLDDDWLALHGPLLICAVKLSLCDRGSLAELTLTRREAYDLVPPTTILYDPPPAGTP